MRTQHYTLWIMIALSIITFFLMTTTNQSAYAETTPNWTCPYCTNEVKYYTVTCNYQCNPVYPDLRTDWVLCYDCNGEKHMSPVTYCTYYYPCH
jgi:hypothetical protein